MVLELGSGVGLTGLTISLSCAPKTVILTDCHPVVLKTLTENIELNIKDDFNEKVPLKDCFLLERGVVRVLSLNWETITPEFCEKLGRVNKIVAADVVYDQTIFKPLLNTVNLLFKYCKVEHFILSCTVRNEDTFKKFIGLVKDENYKIEDLEVPNQKEFVRCALEPIKIFKIYPFSNFW